MVDPIVDKTTLIRNAETLSLKAIPFSKGYRIQVEFRLDPNNTMALDSLELESGSLRQAVALYKKMIQHDLGGNIIVD